MGQVRDDRQLVAAERCIDAMLVAGSTLLTIEELRSAAGVSKRTFHRYFPFKAQSIRPHYAAMTSNFVGRVSREELASVSSWVAAWSEVALGPDLHRDLELFRLIRSDPEYWSVFLEVVQDGERAFADAFRTLSPETPPGHDLDAAAHVTAVAIVASSRLALTAAVDAGSDPVAAFEHYLRMFSPPLLIDHGEKD